MSELQPVYIVDGLRTPFVKAGPVPNPWTAADLGTQVIRQLLLRQPFAPSAIDSLVAGCVMPAATEANIARVMALRINVGTAVTAFTVQRNCASGLQALDSAAQWIAEGRANLVIAGGTEAMSRSPVLLDEDLVRWFAEWRQAKGWQALQQWRQFPWHHLRPILALLRGLVDPVVGLSMGQTAEELAFIWQISRTAMDEFALQSHRRAMAATYPEVVPLFTPDGQVVSQDTGIRTDTTLEKLASLKPVFDKPFGLVTAGNSSQVSDGAAFLLLASAKAVQDYRLPVVGRIIDCVWAGLDPSVMGLGPAYAMGALFKRYNLGLSDIQTIEINEAFAAQVLACLEALANEDFCQTHCQMPAIGMIPADKLNRQGGAIAVGHPLGATGARLVWQVLKGLTKEGALGIASLCIGGGQGGAMLIEKRSGV